MGELDGVNAGVLERAGVEVGGTSATKVGVSQVLGSPEDGVGERGRELEGVAVLVRVGVGVGVLALVGVGVIAPVYDGVGVNVVHTMLLPFCFYSDCVNLTATPFLKQSSSVFCKYNLSNTGIVEPIVILSKGSTPAIPSTCKYPYLNSP